MDKHVLGAAPQRPRSAPRRAAPWSVLRRHAWAWAGVLLALLGAGALPSHAQTQAHPAPEVAPGAAFQVPTREGVSTAVFWQAVDAPRATVLLFPGGGGGFGTVSQGLPSGGNFLVRSVPYFLAQGLNVAVLGRPSDSADLGYADRIAPAHLRDVDQVIAWVRARSVAPLWLVGTSRGTVSVLAVALARQAQGDIAGIVLSSSILNPAKPGALPSQALASLRLPVLMVHHRQDACWVCPPQALPAAFEALTQASVKKWMWVDGGHVPRGEACGPWHHHGYVGQERETVEQITQWLTAPTP